MQINNVDSLTGRTRAEQVAFLANLIESMAIKLEGIEEKLAELEPKILEAQRALQEIETESARLSLKKSLARETYLALAYRVEEERLTTQNFPSNLRLASRASVPDEPVGSGRFLATTAALLLSVFASCVSIIAMTWWRLSFQS